MLRTIRELYRYRALIGALVARHLAMRYRGSVLGFLWSFLNPLCLMLVYVLVFKYFIRFNQVDNYTVFVFCGLLPWLWFSSGLLEGTASIVSSGHLITKSMFPPHILPTVAVLTSMIHFALAIPILLVLMIFSGLALHATLFLLPLALAGQFLFLLGACWALGALNVFYRDVQHIVGNLLTLLFFLSPIVYPSQVVPERFRAAIELNPLALLTRFYQKLILEGVLPSLSSVTYFGLVVAVVLLGGHIIYNSYREHFAELL